ncbi:unnamed protein product [Cylicocyclus nassatus]|uniref:Uncharacterized protein n=1 Tax=Cylicocyclus nassatus TaxID=53992 RepID=A0AA36GH59_CYLNA|nr:unnamed protein product [Cylicocyclus nassatus]
MNVDEGINRLNEKLQQHNAGIFGADGVQVSMHSLWCSRPSAIQGNQYSLKEYDEIDSSLSRPIGTLNCKHFISYCILSISTPLYSKAEIEEAKNRSNEIVSYNGKECTRYEASQKMRAREPLKNQAEMKLNAQLNNYKDFCNQVGLTPMMSRTKYVI